MDERKQIDPKIEQSLRILQMDNAQLNEYISGKMLENPMIEMESVSTDDSQNKIYQRKLEWLEEQMMKEEENSVYFSPEITHPEERPAWPLKNTKECLLEQLEALGQDEDDLSVKFCSHIDDNGYFTLNLSQLVEKYECTERHANKAIELIRSLQPKGVGAFTLSECLKMQLPAGCDLACRLAEDYLPEVASRKWQKIADELQVSSEAVAAAADHLWSCNPRPGTACGREELPFYLTPDILVMKFRDRYEVLLCEYNIPRIQVCQEYVDMAKEQKDPALSVYIKTNMEKVKWLRQCVATRGQTLLKVAKAILRHQERMIHFGPQYMRVITVEELAAELGMQEKTIVHTMKNKYIQTPYGVFPLSNFVLRSSLDNTQTHLNEEIVKEALQEAISKEREENPFSDLKLTQILNAKGYLVSVRMVSKYRQELGIGGEEERMNLNVCCEDEEDDCGCGCDHDHEHHHCDCGHEHCEHEHCDHEHCEHEHCHNEHCDCDCGCGHKH